MSAVPFPLLAHRVRPRWYDLSTLQARISVRDHLVRSRILLLTLIENQLLRQGHRLLVVGAGVAGVNAAMTAAAARNIDVVLIERQAAPFGLQAACTTRYLNAFEYDWPREGWHLQEYPRELHSRLRYDWFDPSNPSPPDYLTVRGTDLASVHAFDWGDQLKQFCRLHSNLQCRWANELLPNFQWVPNSKQWEVSIQDHSNLAAAGVQVEKFDFVVTALGQGEETTAWTDPTGAPVPTKSRQFWENDTVRDHNLGFSYAPKVLIIGLGDGALQDWWRCLVLPDLHCASDVMRRILRTSTSLRQRLKDTAEKLWLGEEQALRAMQFSDTSRTPNLYAVLDRQYRDEIDNLWRERSSSDSNNAVQAVLRPDPPQNLTIVSKEQGGTPQRVYGLNRFFFHFLRRGIDQLRPSGPVLEVLHEPNATLTSLPNQRYELHATVSTPRTQDFDHVIIRAGPAQQAQHTGRVGVRTSLGRAGVPFVAPQ